MFVLLLASFNYFPRFYCFVVLVVNDEVMINKMSEIKYRNIDSVSIEEIRNKHRELKNIFKSHLFVSFLLEILLVITNYACIIRWAESEFRWTLFLHVANLIRAILLLYVIAFVDVSVVKIMGIGKYYKIIRHFRYYTPLGLWILIGFVDLYLLRYTIVIMDIMYFTVFAREIDTFQITTYLLLDVLMIGEFYFSIYTVYYNGVWKNIKDNLLAIKTTNSPQSISLKNSYTDYQGTITSTITSTASEMALSEKVNNKTNLISNSRGSQSNTIEKENSKNPLTKQIISL